MADSVEGNVPLPDMTEEQYRACTLPGHTLEPLDLSTGELGNSFHRVITVKSPITGIGFLVKGLWRAQPKNLLNGERLKPRLMGYWISINAPSAAIGNNCLLRNGVPAACELAVLLLKCWMLEEGATPWVVQAIDMERMRLTMVTPTFLHRFPTHALTQAARAALQVAMEIHNKPKIKDEKRQKRRKKAFSVGDTDEGTAYLKLRNRAVAGYVKNRFDESVAVFSDAKEHDYVFGEAELNLRLESMLHASWLRENHLDRPEDWRLYGQDAAYQRAYAQIRKDLRLDEGLRGTEPTDDEIQGLVANDQTVLRSHLAGQDAQLHPLILAKPTKLARQQYFSDMKLRVMKKLGIDMTIPWAKQKAAFSSGVGEWLHYPGMYTPTAAMQDLVFSEQSVAVARLKLRQLLAQKLPKTLANLALADPPERLIEIGRLEVSERARRTLDQFHMPLHRLLECHSLGCFGEVGLDEAELLGEAARNGEPVTSRYAVGNRTILVKTEYVPNDDARRSPVTSVAQLD